MGTTNSFEGCRENEIPVRRPAHQNPEQYWTCQVNGQSKRLAPSDKPLMNCDSPESGRIAVIVLRSRLRRLSCTC